MSFAKEYSKTTEKRRSYLDNFNSHTKELEPAKAHFQGFYVSVLPQRSWHHCQQLRDLLRVAGGVGSNATAEAVDGQAKAVQLDVVGFGESRMWDGCVEIVLVFDPKDGWLVVAWRLIPSISGLGNG